MTTIQPTFDDVVRLVQLLAAGTRNHEDRPVGNLVQPSLLAQLRASVVADGVPSASRKQAHERTAVNFAAMTLYQDVADLAGGLYSQATEKDPVGSPDEHLIVWLVELAVTYGQGDLSDLQIQTAYERLDAIRTRIMDLFYPPEDGDITINGKPAACPNCGWSRITIHGPDGQLPVGALVRLARPWRSEASVRCRQCNTTWTGEDQLRELQTYL